MIDEQLFKGIALAVGDVLPDHLDFYRHYFGQGKISIGHLIDVFNRFPEIQPTISRLIALLLQEDALNSFDLHSVMVGIPYFREIAFQNLITAPAFRKATSCSYIFDACDLRKIAVEIPQYSDRVWELFPKAFMWQTELPLLFLGAPELRESIVAFMRDESVHIPDETFWAGYISYKVPELAADITGMLKVKRMQAKKAAVAGMVARNLKLYGTANPEISIPQRWRRTYVRKKRNA